MSKIDHSELNKSYINATFSSIRHLLDDNSISEIMLNPHSLNIGQMWVVRTNGLHEKAKYPNGQEIFWDNIKTSQLFQLLSGQNEKITHSKRPILDILAHPPKLMVSKETIKNNYYHYVVAPCGLIV